MKLYSLLFPAACVAGGAFLLSTPESSGFSTIGGTLTLSQRDVRVFNNFTDATANDNQVADASFPGYQGASMACWKAAVEWGSEKHGTGNGDLHQPGTLGSGGANFDASWQGNATSIGGNSDNILSELAATNTGVLAYTETPISNGWRIRFYSNWIWNDGPGASIPGNHIDLQGVACHEYGHALGLGHTNTGGATMFPNITGTGLAQRSIEADDIAGVQFLYGVNSASKPTITNITVAVGGVLTIAGSSFSATGNTVWFTQKAAGGNGNPIKVTGLTSNGSSITVTAPGTAGKGDVLVQNSGSGNANLSNAWPVDPGTTGSGTAPSINSITPSPIEVVAPDGQTVTLSGVNFSGVTSLSLDGIPQSPSIYTIVNDSTITVVWPLLGALGDITISVAAPTGSDSQILTVNACDLPVVDMANSVPLFLFNGSGLSFTMASDPGDICFLVTSGSNSPSDLPGLVNMPIGAGFTDYLLLKTSVIPAQGWTQFNTGPLNLPLLTHIFACIVCVPNEDQNSTYFTETSAAQEGVIVF